ncbi:MAG: MFS transporter [Candidatus Rokuibacteriota bacterium]|nr:MAG: MFS transporter [Candidatus Rokubacteria bacterium]
MQPGSWAALRRPPHVFSAVVVVLSILAPAFSTFITATVLPSAIAEIGGLAIYAWASTAYAVGSILGSAGSSVAVRRMGMRHAVVLAVCVFVVGAAICASAPSMPVVVAGRALQGLGGGTLIASAHSMVRELFPEALWQRMLTTISCAWAIPALGGPVVGGVLAGLGHWRAAFWAMAPIAVIAGALTWRILPGSEPRDTMSTRVPLGRLALICASVLCIGSIANTPAAAARAALVVGAVAAVALMLRLDANAAARLFPTGMLSLGSRIGKGFWMVFLLGMSTTPGGVYVPLLVQVLHGVTPAAAGYLYAVQSLSWTTGTILSAQVSPVRARAVLILGPLLTTTGFTGLFFTIGSGPVAAIAASLMLVGIGIGTCWAHIGTAILSSARPDEGALTASMIPSTQLFAVALGAALSGVIANAAGLGGGASAGAAALAGTWLFGSFVAAPLSAFVIGSRLRPAR